MPRSEMAQELRAPPSLTGSLRAQAATSLYTKDFDGASGTAVFLRRVQGRGTTSRGSGETSSVPQRSDTSYALHMVSSRYGTGMIYDRMGSLRVPLSILAEHGSIMWPLLP
jgi:hypothetical protein